MYKELSTDLEKWSSNVKVKYFGIIRNEHEGDIMLKSKKNPKKLQWKLIKISKIKKRFNCRTFLTNYLFMKNGFTILVISLPILIVSCYIVYFLSFLSNKKGTKK